MADTTEQPETHTQLSAELDHEPSQQLALQLKVFVQHLTDHAAPQQIITIQDQATVVEMVLERLELTPDQEVLLTTATTHREGQAQIMAQDLTLILNPVL